MGAVEPGKGASVGGPPTLSPYELQATAATKVLQYALGIQPGDTHDVSPFSDVYRQSLWKYQSDASKPSMPLFTLRGAAGPPLETPTNWIDEFNNLVQLLPEDVKAEYMAQAKLPIEQRDPAYGNLDAVLRQAADFIVWVKAASQPTDPESLAALHNAQWQALPAQAKAGVQTMGGQIISGASDYLKSVGHNDPFFDAFAKYINQGGAALQDMSQQDKEGLARLVGDLDQWSAQIKQGATGGSLLALGTLMSVMSNVTAATSLPNGSQSLLFGWTTANTGLELPASLKNVQDGIATALKALLPANNANAHMATTLVNAASLAAIAMANLGSPQQTGLSLNMAISSGVLTELGSSIAKACGAQEKNIPLASDLLALSTALMAVQTVGNDSAKEKLVESLSPYLAKWTGELGSWLSASLQSSPTNNEIIHALDVALQRSNAALHAEDYKTFIDTMQTVQGLLSPEGTANQDQLQQGLSNVASAMTTMWQYFTGQSSPTTSLYLG